MPTYNMAHMIERAIDSALAQDYGAANIEILVVDDGSTDGLERVIAPYLDRVRYVRKENGGLVSAINRGVEEATGEFIAQLDADDEWAVDKVSRQVAMFEARPELGLVYTDFETIDEDGATMEPSYFRMLGLTPPRGWILGALLERNYVGSSLMVRASLRDAFHPVDPELVCHDWPIAAAVAAVAEVDVIEEPLYRYRQHGSNMNFGISEEKRLRLTGRENEIRRRLLATVEAAQATEHQLIVGCHTLESHYQMVMGGLGVSIDDLVRIDDAGRAASRESLAAGLAAQRTGDRQVALCRLVNSVAQDPFNADARAALAAAHAGGAPAETALPLRDFAVLAFADELVERPELLAAYGRAFGARDNATLAIYAPGWDDARAAELLPPVLVAAGIDGDDCADLLALAVPRDADNERTLAGRMHAILSERAPDGAFAEAQCFSTETVPTLRELAEQIWTR
jgi:glycosyltransferase involved in cell wall biosynthesis